VTAVRGRRSRSVEELWKSANDRRPARWPATAALVISVALLSTIGLAFVNAERFGTARFWSYPERLSYCGRSYTRSGVTVATKESLTQRVAGGPAWRTVGHTFTGRPIAGPIQPVWSAYSVCTMGLYIPEHSPNSWVSYSLQGGP